MRYRQHGGNDTGARGALSGIKKRGGLIRNGWYVVQVSKIIGFVDAVNPAIVPDDFREAWNLKPGQLHRRIRLSWILVGRGRRRMVDRMVLMVAALFGWI